WHRRAHRRDPRPRGPDTARGLPRRRRSPGPRAPWVGGAGGRPRRSRQRGAPRRARPLARVARRPPGRDAADVGDRAPRGAADGGQAHLIPNPSARSRARATTSSAPSTSAPVINTRPATTVVSTTDPDAA